MQDSRCYRGELLTGGGGAGAIAERLFDGGGLRFAAWLICIMRWRSGSRSRGAKEPHAAPEPHVADPRSNRCVSTRLSLPVCLYPVCLYPSISSVSPCVYATTTIAMVKFGLSW